VPGRSFFIMVLPALPLLLLWPGTASAYAGGVGPEIVGSLALLWWALSAVGAMASWPIYALIRRIRGIKEPGPANAAEQPAAETPSIPSVPEERSGQDAGNS